MTALELALAEAVAETNQDHWRLALALRGAATTPPRDIELAVLFDFVRANSGFDLAALVEAHPEAMRRHLDWAGTPAAWETELPREISLDGRQAVAA